MQTFEEFLIENFYLFEDNINGEFGNLYQKIFIFLNEDINEEWLGIKGIDKKSYELAKETKKYWALFAHFYEKYFGKLNNIDLVQKTLDTLLNKFKDRRVQDAIKFFAMFRSKELKLIDSGIDIDNLSYLQILNA